MDILVLTFPFVVVILFCLSGILLLFKKWKLAICLISIVVCINIYTESIPLNLFSVNQKGRVKVMCWNIDSGGESFTHDNTVVDNMSMMIINENPDVLVLEEYYPQHCSRIDSILSLSYPFKEIMNVGCPNAVYSKYSLSNRMYLVLDSISYRNQGLEEATNIDANRPFDYHRFVIGVTISKGKDSLRVIGCHLSSNRYEETRNNMAKSEDWWEGILQYHLSIKSGSLARETEALYIKDAVEHYSQFGMPVVVCGDMNDVSGSKTLRILQSAGLKNAWWEKGCGLGLTYHGHRFMHFRIDHILHTKDVEVRGIKKISQSYSDHDLLVAEFKWN